MVKGGCGDRRDLSSQGSLLTVQGSSAAAGLRVVAEGAQETHSTVFPKSRLKPAQRQLEDGRYSARQELGDINKGDLLLVL